MARPHRPNLAYQCRYCKSTEVVPVLDKQIEQAPKAGNKYRRHCLSCSRWLPMCSTEYFKQHPNAHVLPASEEPERENLIPLSEYEYTDEIRREKEKAESKSADRQQSIDNHRTIDDSNVTLDVAAEEKTGSLIQKAGERFHWNQVDEIRSFVGDESMAVIVIVDKEIPDKEIARETWEEVVLRVADRIRAGRHGLIQ